MRKTEEYEENINMSGISDVDNMSGQQFELYLSALFKKLGYKVQITPATRDFGADLIFYGSNEKIVVQAKRYSETVSIKSVQEAFSSQAHYDATSALVVTNSFFSSSAKDLANSTGVQLMDRNQLAIILLVRGKTSIQSYQSFKPVKSGKTSLIISVIAIVFIFTLFI